MKIPFLDLKREYLSIRKEINRRISRALEKAEYCYGEETQKFEATFARLAGCKYCAGVGSGTDALMVALKALNIGRGDEVITTPFTFIATAEAIVNVGARPVFVDIDQETMNIDVDRIEEKINKRTKAILPVHMYGVCVDMESLLRIAKKYHLAVAEDVSHAEGSLYKGKPAGSLGDIGCFSLYPSKTLGAYGNAGAVVTNNKFLADKVRKISNHGRGQDRNISQLIGLTGTIDNIQAVILNVKLKYLKQWIERKRKIVQKYNEAFKSLSFLKLQKIPSFCQPSFYVYTILVSQREKLANFLASQGIETKIYYPVPLHLQPSLKFLSYKRGDFPQAEKAANYVLSLPLYPEMTIAEINYVIKNVVKYEDSLLNATSSMPGGYRR